MRGRRGATLIDLMIALGIMAMLFSGIYMVFFSVVDATLNVEARTAAAEALRASLETIRNMPYEKVGVVGAYPPGDIPAVRSVTIGDYEFSIRTVIRNIDDPFDGTLGGSPNDTAPADYKLVELTAECPKCQKFNSLTLTASVSPKGLEASSQSGSLFVNVFDASGNPISGATVNVVNASTVPTISLFDTTNNAGQLQLVGIPTSTQRYQIFISKPGYSSARTYMPGLPENLNPLMPHATVALNQVTNVSFSIDRMSTTTLHTMDSFCVPVGGTRFSVSGVKLIGASPDVLKYSTSVITDSDGSYSFPGGLEWDTYSFALSSAGYYLAGTTPIIPVTINPATTVEINANIVPASGNALLVTVRDAAGKSINGAKVTLSQGAAELSGYAGEAQKTDTNWSGGAYAAAEGIDADSLPGSVIIARNASGTFNPGILRWMESNSIDLGTASATITSLDWSGNVPLAAGADAVRFQIGLSNDGTTFTYAGPDGTSGTYFTTSTRLSSPMRGRFVRYKAYLQTSDENTTPELQSVTIYFSSPCVPTGQVFFQGLPTGSYGLSVRAAGFSEVTSTLDIISGWQRSDFTLSN